MRGALMVCGTSSDAGKSTVVTGLCRLLSRRGVKVAPFKGQNMSLNAMVTADGGEIGRAQWLQAIAARAEPEVAMNPVLLKPTSERASQVVVMGRPTVVEDAATYHDTKRHLVDVVDAALADLRTRYDVVVCEGAGSPAEINLLDHDLVNLGVARRAGIPAILVGDIERGGVFAHLYGTVALLPDELAAAIRGFVINRFRGDLSLLGNATAELEDRCGVPTFGVLPHLGHLALDAEDSLVLDHPDRPSGPQPPPTAGLDVAVIRLPRLANFTDLDPLVMELGVHVRWVAHHDGLGDPDLVVIPGTRATVDDLRWLRATGLAAAIEALRSSSPPPVVLGICGGYQMMGERIDDPHAVESSTAQASGLGWLPVHTVFEPDKLTRLSTVTITVDVTTPETLSLRGYEIRHGRMYPGTSCASWFDSSDADESHEAVSASAESGAVLGTTLHGLFENDAFRSWFLAAVALRRGRAWRPSGLDYSVAREEQIDRIADACEAHLDLDQIWRLVEMGALSPRAGRA